MSGVEQNGEPYESGAFLIGGSNVGPETADGELVVAMIGNDQAAWREFQRRYGRLVRHCITSVTRRLRGLTSEDEPEIQAIFIFSLIANDRRKLRAFDPELGGSLSGWIGRLAANCAHDYVRTLPRRPIVDVETEAALEEVACDLPDPFEQAVDHERAQLAARTLQGFSEIDRRFAALYFGEGLPAAEVARSLGITLNTVYSKRSKIQSRLEAVFALAGAAA
jgi:RNA polymerase sigma-70 factor, ECF subfamily